MRIERSNGNHSKGSKLSHCLAVLLCLLDKLLLQHTDVLCDSVLGCAWVGG